MSGDDLFQYSLSVPFNNYLGGDHLGTHIVLVGGATGQQGGAVARQLLEKGHRVAALTRKPHSEATTRLRESGAEI